MQTRAVSTQAGWIYVRPLRAGDVTAVCALFERLGRRSRTMRFGAPKPTLLPRELDELATADARHHALVAYVPGDARPVGIVRLVRDADDASTAEVAAAVADDQQGKGVGTALMELLLADARAAGVTRIRATMLSENQAARALLRRVAPFEDVRFAGTELEVTASTAGRPRRNGRAAA